MSKYVHPDVKTLRAIADNWWKDPTLNSRKSSRTNTPHDAQAITRLVSTSSLAVQDPYSDWVKEFVGWYRYDQKIDLKSMSTAQLEEKLQKYQLDIDYMFFLSLLTRKVEGPSGSNRLVRIIVMDGIPEDRLSAKYMREETAPTIRMWRMSSKGEQQPFERLLYTLMHEMCHAYFGLFSDQRHPKHKEWLSDFRGHGEMFWVLLRFISRKVGVYTKSEEWQAQLERGEDECYQTTQTKGEAGSWGTPERTLMGGVLGP
ncbi:hypothetical protein F4823DRAFT_637850 [Ustulina deusta]|nr:hypothetical protein F4823DRAFT_637850 [Ustulina deusta]